ncbi:hypothetical protein TELCIR_17031 [Teladorsagia circumcincta]|uniref:Uncharacterized protein n=1 Tax=Teladorsagia circumcincta TaxID=45464 RepID=A0A2G9TU48_TELCI|nr:hypothetical protein TELCIR_17031 [Teladorsagia circumcincta]
MKNGYQLTSFTTSCAPDQEIILYWSDRPDTQGLPSSKRAHLARQAPTFTHTIPSEVAASS